MQGYLPRSDGQPPFAANNSTLPIEIVAIIVEHLISDYQKTKGPALFTPRWYLIPFLLVCKQWNLECEKYLYRTVSVGSHAPFDFPARDSETPDDTKNRYDFQASKASLSTRTPRQGHRVAEDLRIALSKNTRLAGLITKLQLGINPVFRPDHRSPYVPEGDSLLVHEPEWMETNVRILQLCPNVEHVEIRGFEPSELDALVNVLKDKSLISFRISSQTLSGNFVEGAQRYSRIFEMMESWPKLRRIEVNEFLSDKAPETPITLGTSQVSACCPDLREIDIVGAPLHASEVERMRVMCNGGVTNLSISQIAFPNSNVQPAAIVALRDCLRAWSPSLKYAKIHHSSHHNPSYAPLEEAIASLKELQELHLGTMQLDLDAVCRLPRLEHFHCVVSGEELGTFSRQLEDSNRFTSLNHISIYYGSEAEAEVLYEFQNICGRRNIRLTGSRHWDKYWYGEGEDILS